MGTTDQPGSDDRGGSASTKEAPSRLGAFLAELRRRRVFQALLGWGLVSFAVLQVIEPLMHALGLPDWTLKLAVALLAVGFPATVVLAWFFDLSPAGITRTAEAPVAASGLTAPAPHLAPLFAGLVAAGALLGAGVAWVALPHGAQAPAREQGAALSSVAVLPFADMSPQHDQEYFSDGIAEEVLNRLAQVKGLQVVGRTSSFSFKGRKEDLKTIGRALDAGHILEGSVRREGGRVRITAQLVKASDGYQLWSQTYDRELTGVFQVQDEVARAVVTALEVRLLAGGAADPLLPSTTTSPDAYDQYLLGRQLLDRGTLEGDDRAVAAFEKAIELDPSYAPAHAGLARASVYIWQRTGTNSPATRLAEGRARSAAERSIALAPGLSDGFWARARIRMADWDWAGARADVDRVLALGDPRGRGLSTWLLASSGRLTEAISVMRTEVSRDPLSAGAWNNLGWFYLGSGELELARSALDRALELSPKSDYAVGNLAISFLIEGRADAALATWRRCAEERFRMLGTALAEHDLGHREAAERALEELTNKFGNELPYRIAEVHAWRGDPDLAFEWLGQAVARRDPNLGYVREDPLLRRIRLDPRYAALLRRMNLPVD